MEGAGTISGTLLGVFVMGLLKITFQFEGFEASGQQIITGLVLILAVYMDVLKNRAK